MEISLDNGNGAFRIQSYQNACITVNGLTYNQPILISPDHLLSPWGPTSFETLLPEHFEAMLAYHPQVVLLGTGEKLRFPDPKLYQSLTDHKIGVEVMNSAAACRTYMVLMVEGRQVVCGLL